MPAQPGYKTRLLIAEFDLSTWAKDITCTRERNIIDVSGMRPAATDDPDRELIAGRAGGSVTVGGFWDPVAGASDPVIATALDGLPDVLTVAWQGANTIGDRAFLLNGIAAGSPMDPEIDAAVMFSTDRRGTGVAKGGVILHPLVARTTPANYASVDNAASSAFGAVANLHITAFTGTDATIKVADSADDAAWADLITFTTATAVGAQRAAATGTVNRYARVELSGTFTSLTFAVGFARLNV